jgi:hypothetical protein
MRTRRIQAVVAPLLVNAYIPEPSDYGPSAISGGLIRGPPGARIAAEADVAVDPTSPHHHDQTELFSQKRWVTERFCERDILASPTLETVKVG